MRFNCSIQQPDKGEMVTASYSNNKRWALLEGHKSYCGEVEHLSLLSLLAFRQLKTATFFFFFWGWGWFTLVVKGDELLSKRLFFFFCFAKSASRLFSKTLKQCSFSYFLHFSSPTRFFFP